MTIEIMIIEDMVILRFREIKRRCYSVPIKPYYQMINQLIDEYQTISEVPDSKAKSLFGSIPRNEHPTRISYQNCKYQLLVLIINEILELADPLSLLAQQANQYREVLSTLIDTLGDRDFSRFKFIFLIVIGIVGLIGSGILGVLTAKESDNRITNSIFSGTPGLFGLVGLGCFFHFRRHALEQQGQAETFIAQLQQLPLHKIASTRYNVRLTDLVHDTNFDILRVIDLLHKNENLRCMIQACLQSEDELPETAASSSSASFSEEKKSVMPSTLEPGVNQDLELYFIKTQGENIYGGPYCACCISTHIQAQKVQGITPNDPQSRNPIVFDRGRPIFYPLNHILSQWEKVVKKYPLLLKPVIFSSATESKDMKVTTTLPEETKENKVTTTIPVMVEEENSTIPISAIRTSEHSGLTRIPSRSSLLLRFLDAKNALKNTQTNSEDEKNETTDNHYIRLESPD